MEERNKRKERMQELLQKNKGSNDRRHRLDGPAIIESTGSKYWYINGKM